MPEIKQTTPCECVICWTCRGTGNVEVKTDGYPEYDLEACSDCRGSGLSEVCDYCHDTDEEW